MNTKVSSSCVGDHYLMTSYVQVLLVVTSLALASVLGAPREKRSLGLIKYGINRGSGFLAGLSDGLGSTASLTGLSTAAKIGTGVAIPLGLLGKCTDHCTSVLTMLTASIFCRRAL